MTNFADPLDSSVLRSACANCLIGRKICLLDEVSSTNDVAMEWGERGEPEGVVIFAESQTAGRGQFGRHWYSDPGQGIWCSVLLRPTFSPRFATSLTPLAVVAVASALCRIVGWKPHLKPPNDLYLSGRKVCGILTEARTGARFFAVIGVGINVNQEEFPAALEGTATSLRKEVGAPCSRTQVALAVLLELNRLYTSASVEEIQFLYKAWL